MKNLFEIKNETAKELGYINYYEFEVLLIEEALSASEIEVFMEKYATNRVKEVENYYKSHEYGE